MICDVCIYADDCSANNKKECEQVIEQRSDRSRCPVCQNTDPDGVCLLDECNFVFMEVVWRLDLVCPECFKRDGSSGLLSQDEKGIFCCVAGCSYSKKYSEV